MSRRYGRNQKRRDRERIAALQSDVARYQTANAMNEGLAAHLGQKVRRMQTEIEQIFRTVESVCEYSVALPPKQVKGCRPADTYRVAVYDRLEMCDITEPIRPPSARVVDVFALESYLDEYSVKFNTAVHLQYTGGGHSSYMISQSAFESVPDMNLVSMLAPRIAEDLVRHIRKGRRCE